MLYFPSAGINPRLCIGSGTNIHSVNSFQRRRDDLFGGLDPDIVYMSDSVHPELSRITDWLMTTIFE